MISFAAGIAKSGLLPVAHTIAPFIIDRSFEQIKLDFCYHKLPGNIVSVGGTFDYSALGCTHHTYSDIAVLKTLQNIEIFYPTSPIEFDVLFKKNFANKKLSYFRIPKKDVFELDLASKGLSKKDFWNELDNIVIELTAS